MDNLVLRTFCGFSSLDFHFSFKENPYYPFINEILLSKDIRIFRLFPSIKCWMIRFHMCSIHFCLEGLCIFIGSSSQRKYIPEYVKDEFCFQNTASSTCVWFETVTLTLDLPVADQSMWLVISPYSHEPVCCFTLVSDICRLVDSVLLMLVLTIFNSDLVLARVPQRNRTAGYMCMCPKKWWEDNTLFLWG